MAVIQRPVKTYGTRRYTDEVAAAPSNEDPILASEVDGDLDTMYSAWNAGTDSVNIKDGSVTYAKLAADAKQWAITGAVLAPTGAWANLLTLDSTSAGYLRMRDLTSPTVSTCIAPGLATWLWTNNVWGTQENATRPSWGLNLNASTDGFTVVRRAAGGAAGGVNLLALDSAGNLTLPTGVCTYRLGSPIQGQIEANGSTSSGTPYIGFSVNNMWGPQDSARASWNMYMYAGTSTDGVAMNRRAPGAGTGVNTQMFLIDLNGNLTINGPTAIKASGTAWANPSDIRMKKDVTDYTAGLTAINALRPVSFHYNGFAGTTDEPPGAPLHWGFIADEVEPVMPECVGSQEYVPPSTVPPGEESPEQKPAPITLKTLDQSNMILALVNAVQELAVRVAALEVPA